MKKYSTNDEDFIYEGVSDIIDSADIAEEDLIGYTYYEMEAREIEAADVINIDQILENMDEKLYALVGECADNVFYSLSKEAKNALHNYLVAFIEEHKVLDGYWKAVGKSKELTITEADL